MDNGRVYFLCGMKGDFGDNAGLEKFSTSLESPGICVHLAYGVPAETKSPSLLTSVEKAFTLTRYFSIGENERIYACRVGIGSDGNPDWFDVHRVKDSTDPRLHLVFDRYLVQYLLMEQIRECDRVYGLALDRADATPEMIAQHSKHRVSRPRIQVEGIHELLKDL